MTSAHAESSTEGTESNRDVPSAITIISETPITIATGIYSRGDVVEVTPALVEATTDREGECFLTIADDEAEQVRRYGERKFIRGNHGDEIKAADGVIEAEREAAQARAASDSGLDGLREAWREESEAARNAVHRWQSRTLTAPRPLQN